MMNATETVVTSFGKEYNEKKHIESNREELNRIKVSLGKAVKTITEIHPVTNEEIAERLGVIFVKGATEEKINALRREGLKNYQIAEILNMPESKVRAIV